MYCRKELRHISDRISDFVSGIGLLGKLMT